MTVSADAEIRLDWRQKALCHSRGGMVSHHLYWRRGGWRGVEMGDLSYGEPA